MSEENKQEVMPTVADAEKELKDVVEVAYLIAVKAKEELKDGFQPKDIFDVGAFIMFNSDFRHALKEAGKDLGDIRVLFYKLEVGAVIRLVKYCVEKFKPLFHK